MPRGTGGDSPVSLAEESRGRLRGWWQQHCSLATKGQVEDRPIDHRVPWSTPRNKAEGCLRAWLVGPKQQHASQIIEGQLGDKAFDHSLPWSIAGMRSIPMPWIWQLDELNRTSILSSFRPFPHQVVSQAPNNGVALERMGESRNEVKKHDAVALLSNGRSSSCSINEQRRVVDELSKSSFPFFSNLSWWWWAVTEFDRIKLKSQKKWT